MASFANILHLTNLATASRIVSAPLFEQSSKWRDVAKACEAAASEIYAELDRPGAVAGVRHHSQLDLISAKRDAALGQLSNLGVKA